MSSDKRLILCFLLSALCFFGLRLVLVEVGLIKEPPPVAKKPAGQPPADQGAPDRALAQADPAPEPAGELPANPFMPAAGVEPGVPPIVRTDPVAKPVRPSETVILGAGDVDNDKDPYLLRLELSQDDASVERATSSRYDSEFDRLNRNRKPGRLVLIQPNLQARQAPGSLAIAVASVAKRGVPVVDGDEEEGEAPLTRAGAMLTDWEIVREPAGSPAARAVSKAIPGTTAQLRGQEVHYRAKLDQPAVEVTKIFRIWEGQEGFEMDLKFAAPTTDAKFTYRLIGPHGIPIEGEWYTTTFRDVFFGLAKKNATEVITRTGYDAFQAIKDPAQRVTTDPLVFAGVEDQYFATFVQPWPTPKTQEERWDAAADSYIIKANATDAQKTDLTVAIDSKPVTVGPNLGEVVHSYRVFAGPKTAASLAPYQADELSSYRKNQWITIPFAASLAKSVIAPLLERIYWVTTSVSRWFGGTKGNYGIAIILLTMTVRLMMFPIGRKQAMMAKKMQDLQPILVEVKNQFKDDKEAIARETMAVYKRNKVNPAAGCVPALIQMPIFVGLWQCLNNSVELRHSAFLYIRDLAAPDMLFRFPVEIPFIGWYLNALPFVVVTLMLVQTKLFSPPPTTPEAEAQQKMMKYMMVFMAFMFYKVPSGLGLYFITSSLWQIGERLLLPKIMKTPATTIEIEPPTDGKGPRTGPGRGPTGGGEKPRGWLGQRLEKLLEDAAKDTTIRNPDRDGNRDRNGTGSGRANGDGGRSRSKPPGKRR